MERKQKIKKVIILSIIMVVCGLSCLFFDFVNPWIVQGLFNNFNIISNKDALLVHYVSVGQGDAIAINLPDGKTALIDVGSQSGTSAQANYVKDFVLNSKLNNKIDYLILTHADSDHIGATMKVLQDFDIETIYYPVVQSTSKTYQEMNSYVKENKKYVLMNTTIDLSANGYSFVIYEPIDYSNTNSSCPLIKLEYKNKSFLFTGDITSSVELKYLSKYGDEISCDVLKVSHHGSKTATSELFLDETSPDYAVISSGNRYGHPDDEVINKLNQNEIKTLRTDEQGNIVFVVGNNYDLQYKTGEYHITMLSLDYRYLILVFEICCGIKIILILSKKEKKSSNS